MRFIRSLWTAAQAGFLAVSSNILFSGALVAATIDIDIDTVTHPHAPLLLGESFDARTNFQSQGVAIGYFSPTDGSTLPIGQYWKDHFVKTTLRYPQGPVNVWNWKQTVGPQRPKQPLLTNQSIIFGLDEFMSMIIAEGVDPKYIHFMVNLYGDINNQNIPVAVQDAADLVEYLNMPAGAGYYWADQRAANGRTAPYGVQLFNLGNEPWADAEYNFLTSGDPDPNKDGAKRYVADAELFIDAMQAVDPSIGIVLSATSPRPSASQKQNTLLWNQTLIDLLGDKIYGVAINLYYDSLTPGTYGVAAVESYVDDVSQQLETYNNTHSNQLRIIVGEHAHAIHIDYSTFPPTSLNPDFAMQWQGAVGTANFLMMASQKSLIERAHFFIYGNTTSGWHPIRYDGLDTAGKQMYTVMPAATLYEYLGPVILEQALKITSVSPVTGSDGEKYTVRGGAFRTSDRNRINVILVNRDPVLSQAIDVTGLDSYTLDTGFLLTAQGGPTAESVQKSDLTVTPNQRTFSLPSLGVVVLQFSRASSGGQSFSATTIDLTTLALSADCVSLISNDPQLGPALRTSFTFDPQVNSLALTDASFITGKPSPCTDELRVRLNGGVVTLAIYSTPNLQAGNLSYAVTAFYDAASSSGTFIFNTVAAATTSGSTGNYFSQMNGFANSTGLVIPASSATAYVFALPTSTDGSDIVLLDNGIPVARAASGANLTLNIANLGTGSHLFTTRVLNAYFQTSVESPVKNIFIQ